MVSCCKALPCCKDRKSKKRLICGGICFLGALICFSAIGPVYMAAFSTPTSSVAECMRCGADYGTYVINEMNGGAIVDKIVGNHEHRDFHRGSHRHHHGHHRHDEDVCITDDDLKGLRFEDLDVKPVPQACIDTCAPIAKRAALAAGCAAATVLCAFALLLCSLVTFACALFCKKKKKDEPAAYCKVSSDSQGPIVQGVVGTAASGVQTMKTPLLDTHYAI